jgi:ADP-ribose pyrophosphatase YjhB (NUDIX family)
MTVYRVKPIADLALISGGSVLLVKYAGMPDHQQGWFLPHDLMKEFEHPEKAVIRMAKNDLRLPINNLRLGFIESFRGNDKSWHLSFHYVAETPKASKLRSATDLAAANWFPLVALPTQGEVAHHGWALTTLKKQGL